MQAFAHPLVMVRSRSPSSRSIFRAVGGSTLPTQAKTNSAYGRQVSKCDLAIAPAD